MEKNYSSTDRSAVFDRALSLPHFDEEATLLSARPVVPLHGEKAETHSKRWVSFGLTILVAILVGAISATLLIRRGQNSQSAAESEVSQPTVSSVGAAGGSTSDPAEARMSVAPEPAEKPQKGEAQGARDLSIKKRQTASILHSSMKPAISRSSTKPSRPDYEMTEDFENEKGLRRAERRDARREARRQLRQRRDRMGDDVLRIREIFEGAPRP
jgi:hypothetical protein